MHGISGLPQRTGPRLRVAGHRSFVGAMTILIMATVMASCSSKKSSSASSNAQKIRSAEEQFKAKNGAYGTQDELVSAGLLKAPVAVTDVILTNGQDGKPKSAFTIPSARVNVPANADHWISSASGP